MKSLPYTGPQYGLDCRFGSADMLRAAEWYSRHTRKPVVVLSDRLAAALGAEDDADVTEALQSLDLNTAEEQPPEPTCAYQPTPPYTLYPVWCPALCSSQLVAPVIWRSWLMS